MKDSKGYFGLIYDHYSQFLAKEIIIAYDGDVTHQVMKAFTSLVEEKLEADGEEDSVIRRVYHILVECLQNINRHAEAFNQPREKYPGRGALLVSKTTDYYRVITANVIVSDYVPELREFMETINPMSEDQLNERYKEQLKNASISARGGAGLGFIDIRRKTGNPLEYHFIAHDEAYSFFLLNVVITR
jgi:hypothetical protein